jgi:putative tryptophan/tyrosine transport system substrate-binding protein
MSKKLIVLVVSALLLALSFPAQAQQPTKVYRIGHLSASSASSVPDRMEAFRQGLRALGYVEGKNFVIESRYAEGKLDRLSELAVELVRLKVDVILTAQTPVNMAAKQATSTIPIVFVTSADPVETGLVASLAHPGGNVTGLSNLAADLTGKRLELLKEALPKVKRVGFIWDPANAGLALRFKEIQTAARTLNITILSLEVRSGSELLSALDTALIEHIDALMVTAPMAAVYQKQVMDFAKKKRLPVMYDTRESVENAGGLISYGPSFPDLFRRAATYVDKILKGAKPAEIPVEQPTKFALAINLKTAKQIGITIPQSVLYRADKVIR